MRNESAAAQIALFTTLPILWAEREDLRGYLRGVLPPHWALAALRRHGEVRALDSLVGAPGDQPLAPIALLVMAQPRALAPQENVALDRWVREGGRVLIFADPLLTEDSAFAIGDRRRPQDVILLSPILARWGLQLAFDQDQRGGEHLAPLFGGSLPVNLPGRLTRSGGVRGCNVLAGGVAASCRIGRGRALVVADAALLEKDRAEGAEGRREIFDRLLVEVLQRD